MILMLGMSSLVFACVDLLGLGVAVCLPTSLLRLLAFCVSVDASFRGLLCELVGVESARLMASSRVVEMAA